MFREGDSVVFQRITGALRKPIVRFRLASGRQIELLGFHLEPAWALGDPAPRPIIDDVLRRLYPNERAVFVQAPDQFEGAAFLCVAYLYSDTPVRLGSVGNYSLLLVCGLVSSIERPVRSIVAELLAQVDWETSATDDSMW